MVMTSVSVSSNGSPPDHAIEARREARTGDSGMAVVDVSVDAARGCQQPYH